jgi:DNA-directed RNA polymerase subunit omega
MINTPTVDELMKQVPSKYALVILASKRARQINAYHKALGEGQLDDTFAPVSIETNSKNYLTMALEELAAGKLEWEDPADAE